jgi:hypothetical protein
MRAHHLLMEVVLITPVEHVLAPWIDRAPTEASKQWIATNYRNWLVKSPENLHKLPYLPINADEKQKKAFSFDDLYDIRMTPGTENQLEHMMDFFDNNPNLPRLERMSVDNVRQAADQWVQRMITKGKKQPDDPAEVKTVMEFPGGYRIVDLIGQKALQREGALMGHCVGGGSYCDFVRHGEGHIYSLRDSNNEPHVTMQIMANKTTAQIKGRSNKAPVRKYWAMLRGFFDQAGVKVNHDYQNVGLLRIQDNAGGFVTMTQDQFKDMILDPDNEDGERLLKSFGGMTSDPWSSNARHDDDIHLGMFNALYGTARLTDAVIGYVFRRMPEQAIHTVEHYGNKFTPEQAFIAFTTLYADSVADRERNYKAMIQVIKPDEVMCRRIVDWMTANRETRAPHDESFVTALAQVQPEIYKNMVLAGGEQGLMDELASHGGRASAPFFVFAGTDEYQNLMPEMIYEAFSNRPVEAMKKIQRIAYGFNTRSTLTAFQGLAHKFYSQDSKPEFVKVLEELLTYTKPDEKLLALIVRGYDDEHEDEALNNSITSGNMLPQLVVAARKIVPASMTQETTEAAIMGIDTEQWDVAYLRSEPQPSLAFQKYVLASRVKVFHHAQNVDPEIYREIYQHLRPAMIDPMMTANRSVEDKKHKGHWKQVSTRRKRTSKEMGEQQKIEYRNAVKRFSEALNPAIRDPAVKVSDRLNKDSPKFKAGQQVFAAMDKSKLFDLAVRYIDRDAIRDLVGKQRNQWGFNDPEEISQRQAFINNMADLTPKDIVRLIDQVGYDNELFADLINHAPQRVPEVMAAYKLRNGFKHGTQWGKLDWKDLNKEKLFDALEAVWASDRVPEGFKDDFTVNAFRRFKPSPAKLIGMLKQADNEEAFRYVLKKTKRPSVELLNLALDDFPMLVGEHVNEIPEAILVRVFTENNRLVRVLVDRDLRGWGPRNARSKYSGHEYSRKLDRGSDTFAKYARAAHEAGKEKEFETLVRQGELDELSSQLVTWDGARHVVNEPLLVQHLHEYGIATLATAAQDDHSGRMITIYFEHFTPQKLAKLALAGMFSHYTGYHGYRQETVPKGLDPEKMQKMMAVLVRQKGEIARIFKSLYDAGYQATDEATLKGLITIKGSYSDELKNMVYPTFSDAMKDYAVDHNPFDIDDFPTPTPHMVEVLFDKFCKIDREKDINWTFARAFRIWVKKSDSRAAKLIKAEAMRRKGMALVITRTMFKELHDVRNKKGDGVHLPLSPPVTILRSLKPSEKDDD